MESFFNETRVKINKREAEQTIRRKIYENLKRKR